MRLGAQLTHPFAVILWAAAALAFFTEYRSPGSGMSTLAGAIVAVIEDASPENVRGNALLELSMRLPKFFAEPDTATIQPVMPPPPLLFDLSRQIFFGLPNAFCDAFDVGRHGAPLSPSPESQRAVYRPVWAGPLLFVWPAPGQFDDAQPSL